MTVDEVIRSGGGVTKLARLLRVSHNTVSSWRIRGRIPVAAAMRISDRIGISRSEIRPDIWPDIWPPEKAA